VYKGYTSPFYDNPKDWTRPEALVRLQFPPSRTIEILLTDYSQNYSYFRQTPLLLAKINIVTHLDWS
jgi:hypothetical protein